VSDTITFAGADGGAVPVSRATLSAFAGQLEGRLLEPPDAGFDEAILIWNAMASTRPACVVQPVSVVAVAATQRFATEHGLLVTIKGGGHNVAGLALARGALTLDMSRMRNVDVDTARSSAVVGAGCLLRDVDTATQAHGLAAVLGFVSETGVAGLTLGGGFGYLTRRYGWTVDGLREVQIVTPDGAIRRASREEHPDLFWAVRGGGGNLGVVTSFTFDIHPVGPEVTGGLIAWSAERSADLLALYRDVTAAAPRELTIALVLRLAPPAPFIPADWHGKPIVAMVVCHTGEASRAERDLEPLRRFGTPIADLITRKPYVQQQSMLDATQPKGLHDYWKSEFVPGLSSGLLGVAAARAALASGPRSQITLFHLGGALNERAEDDGAVGNRDARYVCVAATAWPAEDPGGDRHREWVRATWEAVRPFSTGGNYVNFQTADEDESRTRDAYRRNLARLAEVKARYDPGNVLRVNRNVAPAGQRR
jgi:FAD/FMN-containing dehydrogenase